MASSMMFWRFGGGYAGISSIDTILDKPDCTLEELLDESDVEQELKTQNAKLIEFLRDEAVLRKLLKYVVAAKPLHTPAESKIPAVEEEKSKAIGFFESRSKVRSKSRGGTEDTLEAREEKWRRYSYVSTQLLSSEVWSIVESLLEYPDLLRDFWDYIKAEPELDNMQAGNFSKVNETLLDKKPAEMAAFFKTIDGIVDNMIKHVNCPVVMDLLLKIISLEKDSAPGIVDWLQSEDLVPKLMSFITPTKSPTVQTAAGDFLKAIITISANATGQDASVIGPNELTRQLVSETCLNQLLSEMMQGGNPLTVGVGIIIEVIRKNNSDYDQDTQIGPEPKSSDPIFLGTLLRIFSNHIGDFMDLILSPKHTIVTDDGAQHVVRKDLATAWGTRIEPLGFDRFKTCELMAELLHCSNMSLLNEKNAEVEVERRDAERKRLKAEGRLAADRPQEVNDEAFGASVDSHGFHHAEASSPLGESPEKVPVPDDTSTVLEEEFEKVDLTDMPSKDSTSTSPRTSLTERRSSLLTEQLQREKEKTMIPQAGSVLRTVSCSDKPAPLFSKRAESPPIIPFPVGASTIGTSDSKPQSSGQIETKVESLAEDQKGDASTPVVGDLLKMKFVEHRVVPTIIDFFFRFPWNNFLHNVVYDVVQQVFNGAMDRGYNKYLAIDLFETGRVTERVVHGQQRSDESQHKEKMRLGYMGHLTLIAEEVVKFTDRQPADSLAQVVVDKISDSNWKTFVEQTLTETRERDNAILGGVRPDSGVGARQAVLNAVNAANNAGYGEGNSLSGTGVSGLDSLDLTNASIASFGLSSGSNQLLGDFSNSDDEDEDANDHEVGGSDGAAPARRRISVDDEEQTNLDDAQKPAPLSLPPMDRSKRTSLKGRRKAGEGLARPSSTSKATLSPDNEIFQEPEPSVSRDLRKSSANASAAIANALTSGSGFPSTTRNARATATDADFPDVDASYGYAKRSQSGFEDDFTGFGSDEVEDGSSDDDEMRRDKNFNDEDEDEDEHQTLPLKRQSTTEAVERRPLDEGSNSSDEEEDESSDNEIIAPAASIINTNATGPVLPPEDAKKMEQDKLLKRWGFDEDSDDDDDDDDDDDEPVSMGSKYTARRRTGS